MAKRKPVGRPTPVSVTGQQFEMLEVAICELAAKDWRYCRAARGFAINANMQRAVKVIDAIEAANINTQGGLVFDDAYNGIKIVGRADDFFAKKGIAAGSAALKAHA